MTLSLATLQPVHMHRMQSVFLAELPQIRDNHPLSIRINEAIVRLHKSMEALSAILMDPALMAAYPAVGDRHHVRVVQPTFATEGGKVSDWTHRTTVGVDKAVMGLDIIPLPQAVAMRPALVGLQLALSHGEPVHRGKVQAVLTAKAV